MKSLYRWCLTIACELAEEPMGVWLLIIVVILMAKGASIWR